VEDDNLVRELVVVLLKRQGYTVLDVGRASHAMEVCRSYPAQIDTLLTELLMPGGMDGHELAEQAIAIRTGLRVLLMSGYTTDALVLHGLAKGPIFCKSSLCNSNWQARQGQFWITVRGLHRQLIDQLRLRFPVTWVLTISLVPSLDVRDLVISDSLSVRYDV
jgi:CheY-like chemotaxis protein